MGDGVCNPVTVQENSENDAGDVEDGEKESSQHVEYLDNFDTIEQNGFNVLQLLDDSLCTLKNTSCNLDCDSNVGSGKRNRQDSCNSTSNEAMRKVNKKSRKKHAKKLELDAEIEKIMADIEMGSKVPVEGTNVPKTVMVEDNTVPSDNVKCEKLSKKKRKKKSQQTLASNTVIPENTENCKIQCNESDEIKENDVSKLSCAEDDVCKKISAIKNKNSNESKKDRKRPGKKQIALIQAAVKKAEEENERLRQEELAKQKRAEEMERLRLEKLKQEEERKLKKKMKEKEKRVRLKAEGKILTKAQKLARIRVEASKTFWKEQLNVPKTEQVSHSIETSSGPTIQKENVCGKDDEIQSKSSDGNSERSPTISISSQESMEVHGSCESESTSISSELGIERRSRHVSESISSNKTTMQGVLQRCDSYNSLNRHYQSELTINCTDIDAKLLPTKSLPASVSLHCLNQCENKNNIDNSQNSLLSSFRSPVVCVLGHVDTGKTKILDKIRKTHVQTGEAGGITQQIGATMVPRDSLKEKCGMVKSFSDFHLKLPGLLIIDTPGHESFRNLRFRGTSLCDIAILVVDIMHGVEPQTIESINLLKERSTPFVIALNKIDRLYSWSSSNEKDIEDVIKQQSLSVQMEFDKRFKEILLQFANQSLNISLYYENPDPHEYISVVPVSAISGDGMGNLLALVCQMSQNMMPKKLIFSENLQASVLEVKTTPGLGTTIDVILVNGRLREGDTIVLVGQDGPIVSQIRSLLMPQPLKELRVKNPYIEYKEVKGAQGVKVSGRELDKAIAGLPLYVATTQDQILPLKKKVTSLFHSAMNSIRLSERGVYVQASTLGSLEALLEYLKTSEIPYSGVKVGPVVKKDVIKASVMLEHDIQYAVILAFDVKIEKDAQDLADHMGIKIFQADIIYHLFDEFVKFRDALLEKRKNDIKKLAVFPCKLRILPEYVFSVRDPIALGVRVEAGILKIGTPICVPTKNALFLGNVISIEKEHQAVESAKVNDEVCIKIEAVGDESSKTYGKHFDDEDILVSRISRQTIDVCKEYYRKDLSKSDWQLMVELKRLLNIV